MNCWTRTCWALSLGAITGFGGSIKAADNTSSPPFLQVYDLVRSNLVGASEEELNDAAVKGFVSLLEPRVKLVTSAGAGEKAGPSISKTAVYDGAYGYVRVREVDEDLPKDLADAWHRVAETNQLKGLVLDLRYADGQDMAAAAAAADGFLGGDKPLMDWGKGMVSSKPKTNYFPLPVTVLVNDKTRGAAEALAGVLRETDLALLIGTNTAGRVYAMKDFRLANGDQLRIAAAPVRRGDGKVFPTDGLKPDIAVPVSPEDEQAYFEDPYKVLPRMVAESGTEVETAGDGLAATNHPPRRRLNEAELVRLQKEGLSVEEAMQLPLTGNAEPPRKMIHDPALARGIDLLKGLAVMRQYRAP